MGDVETALSGYFQTVLRNETNKVWFNLQCDLEDLGGISHFEIELCVNALPQFKNIPILNMATIQTQMHRDRICTSRLRLMGGSE